MKVHFVAFMMGLVAMASADVRDVLNNRHQSVYPSVGQPFSKQQTQNFATGNAKRFWWAESPLSPFTRSERSHSINNQNSGCGSGCATQNTIHNTHQQHQPQFHQQPQQQIHTKQQQQAYSQNPFMQNAIAKQQNIYAQMASLSGSPNEVNNLMADSAFRYRPAPKIPCYGASQVCAPKDSCRSGFISESDLRLVQSQANVSSY